MFGALAFEDYILQLAMKSRSYPVPTARCQKAFAIWLRRMLQRSRKPQAAGRQASLQQLDHVTSSERPLIFEVLKKHQEAKSRPGHAGIKPGLTPGFVDSTNAKADPAAMSLNGRFPHRKLGEHAQDSICAGQHTLAGNENRG